MRPEITPTTNRARGKEVRVLPELGVVDGQEGVYIRNPPVPEDPPDIHHHFPPRRVGPDSPDPPPKLYPLIATMIIDRDVTTLMRLEDWIELVGGTGHAQALLQEAGWQDPLPIETHLHHSASTPETSPTNRHIPAVIFQSKYLVGDFLTIMKKSHNERGVTPRRGRCVGLPLFSEELN